MIQSSVFLLYCLPTTCLAILSSNSEPAPTIALSRTKHASDAHFPDLFSPFAPQVLDCAWIVFESP